MAKAATYLSISSRQEVNIALRRSQEHVHYLEEQRLSEKNDFLQ